MLFRTTSTPALASCLLPLPERCRDPELLDSDARHRISTGPALESASASQEFGPWFRRVDSENDLDRVGSFAAEAFSHTEKDQSRTTPQKQWSRRMSLRRHSSLPCIGESKSSLDSFLDEILPAVQESAFSLEEISSSEEELGNCPVASFSGGHCHAVLEISDQISLHPRQLGFGMAQEQSKVTNPMAIAGGGFGIGIGSTGGRTKTGGSNGNSEPGSIDAYYRRMLQKDPGNPLLLRNYARYLHEVSRDLARAEEFYERAILACPDDAELRSQYAKLIWEFRQDEERAACYFEQAAQTSPDDCNVLGAYAAFMWDVDEQEEVQHRPPPAVTLAGPSPTMVSA